jgi:hypothetical protein
VHSATTAAPATAPRPAAKPRAASADILVVGADVKFVAAGRR